MAARTKYEYVEMEDPAIVVEDMAETSEDFAGGIKDVDQLALLQRKKHRAVNSTKKILKELLKEVSTMQEDMHHQEFEEEKPTRARRRKDKKLSKVSQKEHEDNIKKAREAMANLSSNLKELGEKLHS